jgi:hypothetical protein
MKRIRFRGTVTKKPTEEPEESNAIETDNQREDVEDTPSRLIAKEERQREAEEAMADYLAQQEAARQKTELLRGARLAQRDRERPADKG